MTAADSNVLLRLFLNDVPAQADTVLAWLIKQPRSSVIVTDSVLTEVLFLLESKRAYGYVRAEFMPKLLQLLGLSSWQVTSLTQQALQIFTESKLDYTDCLLLAMQERKVVSGVATFDKELIAQTGDILSL